MERPGHDVALTNLTWPNCSVASLLRGIFTGLLAGGIVLTTALPTNSDYDGRPRYSKQEIRRAVLFYAKRYRLDPALLRAVIKVESDFRPHVISRKGAVGLMQLTPDTAATLRVADIHDPMQNIRGGAKQLRHLLRLYDGDVTLALAAYNAGVHRVRGGKIPRIRETRSYVRKVLRYYNRYRIPQHGGKTVDLSPGSTHGPAPKARNRERG